MNRKVTPSFQIRVDNAEQLLEEPDHQSADQDADRVFQAAEDRRRECFDPRHRAHVGPREVIGAIRMPPRPARAEDSTKASTTMRLHV